jgi:hypothetical protein
MSVPAARIKRSMAAQAAKECVPALGGRPAKDCGVSGKPD